MSPTFILRPMLIFGLVIPVAAAYAEGSLSDIMKKYETNETPDPAKPDSDSLADKMNVIACNVQYEKFKDCCLKADREGCPLAGDVPVVDLTAGEGLNDGAASLIRSSLQAGNAHMVRARVCEVAIEKVTHDDACAALPASAGEMKKKIAGLRGAYSKINAQGSADFNAAGASMITANASGSKFKLRTYTTPVLGKNVDQSMLIDLKDSNSELVDRASLDGGIEPVRLTEHNPDHPGLTTCSGVAVNGTIDTAAHCLPAKTLLQPTDVYGIDPSTGDEVALDKKGAEWEIDQSVEPETSLKDKSPNLDSDWANLPKPGLKTPEGMTLAYSPDIREGCYAYPKDKVVACSRTGLHKYLDGEIVEYMGFDSQVFNADSGPVTNDFNGADPGTQILRSRGTGTYDDYSNAAWYSALAGKGSSGGGAYLPGQEVTVNGVQYPVFVGNNSQAAYIPNRDPAMMTGAQFVEDADAHPENNALLRIPIETFPTDGLAGGYKIFSISSERLYNSQNFMDKLIRDQNQPPPG